MKQPIIWRVIIPLLAATVVLSACSGNASQPKAGVEGTVWVADEEGNTQ